MNTYDKRQARSRSKSASAANRMKQPSIRSNLLQLQRAAGNRATIRMMKERALACKPGAVVQKQENGGNGETTGVGETRVLAEHRFEAGGEAHTLWAQEVDGRTVVMVASDPMTVQQRLRKWRKEADSIKDSKLKTNAIEWIGKCWGKLEQLSAASETEDREARQAKVHEASANLKDMIGRLFWAFHMDLPELGAVAVYRGLHFSKDWETKRGRTVEEESARGFEDVQAEGNYSSASWELAKKMAGDNEITKRHLEIATDMIMKVIAQWQATTDYTREDTSKQGTKSRNTRVALENGIQGFKDQNNVAKAKELEDLLENQKKGFTQSGYKFGNQFLAAVSRYIDRQSTFEEELAAGSEGGYKDVPFKQIPFISTSKSAAEAVKYAQGKLASEDNRSTEGPVGRVLVYVAHRIDLLEAGGIDVWHELGEGKLRFTEWRMNENEITFSGKIPDHFLRTMTPVDGADPTDVAANRAEIAAAKAAAPFGGLKPLPVNKPHE